MSKASENYVTIKKELFKTDKNLKKEYDALAPRYELISKAIDARLKKKNDSRKSCRKNWDYKVKYFKI